MIEELERNRKFVKNSLRHILYDEQYIESLDQQSQRCFSFITVVASSK